MTSVLNVDDLVVRRGGVEVLHRVAIEVSEGETVAVLGRNGAGKTTLLRTIAGLIRPTSGTVRLMGTDVADARPHRVARLGLRYVPERGSVFADLTVEENLRVGGLKAVNRRPIDDVFAIFPELRHRAGSRAGTLSIGQQRMLALGAAIIASPRVLLLDEPSLGLSPAVEEDLFQGLARLAAGSTSIVLVEQSMPRALSIADRGYVVHLGEVVIEAPADRIPSHPLLGRTYLT